MRSAALALALVLVLEACGRDERGVAPVEPNESAEPGIESGGTTRASIRNTDLHVKEGLVLSIGNLVGRLGPTGEDRPPTFDAPESFYIEVESASVSMLPSSLAALLNGHVFASPESPIKNLEVEIEEGKLKQRGVLDKGLDVPFEMEGEIRATPDGDILIHTTSLKAAGLPVQGIMDFFGIEMAGLIESEKALGLRVSGDDLILDPEQALPPPRVRGRVTDARIEEGRVWLAFGDPAVAERALAPEGDASEGNFLFFRGGPLRFGKLSMRDSDLRLLDADPGDRFDFSLVQYNRHLVAGYSKNTTDYGLRVFMPDLEDMSDSTELRPPSAR